MKWARPKVGARHGRTPASVSAVLKPGDVIYVSPRCRSRADGTPGAPDDSLKGQWTLQQIPDGRAARWSRWIRIPAACFAIVGGFSFAESQFDRATQARRQPGSSFKPLIYATALDNGYTPASIVVDGPICVDQGKGMPQWCPKNYEAGSAAGPSTLRFGIEHSRNLMTVRLSPATWACRSSANTPRRFGVYDNLMPALSMALGAGETTLLRMVDRPTPCSANGGKQIKADLHRSHPGSLWPHHLAA